MEAKKILIIDDDTHYLESINIILKTSGYALDFATTGEEGLQKAREINPDLVLLDVMMATPDEGFVLSREFARDEKLKSIPVILVTGIRKEMNLPFGFEPDNKWIPVKAILEKLIIPDKLFAVIEEYCA